VAAAPSQRDPLSLLRLPLAQPHPRAAAVFVEELDAGQGAPNSATSPSLAALSPGVCCSGRQGRVTLGKFSTSDCTQAHTTAVKGSARDLLLHVGNTCPE
jgi:hypothetical protein